MARYVVLYFEDNEDAEQFSTYVGEVTALVPAPTLFCQGCKGGKTQTGWFKGPKYGWWVCAKCGKPSRGWAQNYRAVISSAKNLLDDVQKEPPPFGWDQDVD